MAAKKAGKSGKNHVFILSVLIAVFIDQLTKYLARAYKPSSELIGNFLSITYTQNTGAAFGMLKNTNIALAVVTAIVLVAIIYYYKRISPKFIPFTALLFAGALGNLIDRIALGYVVDFISFSFWPAFNVADIAVTFGVLGLILWIWRS